VRLVVLVVVFIAADNLHMTHTALRSKLEAVGLGPITRRDIVNILVNPFVERYNAVINFARQEVNMGDDGLKGLIPQETDEIVEEVAARCLEIACKVSSCSLFFFTLLT
jgi:ATP-dependent Lon protease